MTSAAKDSLSRAVGPSGAEALRRFRRAVAEAFPGRLRALVLFGSRARGDHGAASDWDVAAFIEDFDRDRESRRLNLLVVPFHLEDIALSPIGLPADRHGVSPDLLASIDRDGIHIGEDVVPPGDAPRPRLSRAERQALAGFAGRAAAALPGRVARVALLGPRPAGDGDFPVAVVLRAAVTAPEERRALRRLLDRAAIPAVAEGVYVQVHILHLGGPDAARGVTLWCPPAEGAE